LGHEAGKSKGKKKINLLILNRQHNRFLRQLARTAKRKAYGFGAEILAAGPGFVELAALVGVGSRWKCGSRLYAGRGGWGRRLGEEEEVRETEEVLGPRRAVPLQVGPDWEVSSLPGARSPSTACPTAFVQPGRRSIVRQGRWRRIAAGASGVRRV